MGKKSEKYQSVKNRTLTFFVELVRKMKALCVLIIAHEITSKLLTVRYFKTRGRLEGWERHNLHIHYTYTYVLSTPVVPMICICMYILGDEKINSFKKSLPC